MQYTAKTPLRPLKSNRFWPAAIRCSESCFPLLQHSAFYSIAINSWLLGQVDPFDTQAHTDRRLREGKSETSKINENNIIMGVDVETLKDGTGNLANLVDFVDKLLRPAHQFYLQSVNWSSRE